MTVLGEGLVHMYMQRDLFPGFVLILTFQLKILQKDTVQPQA